MAALWVTASFSGCTQANNINSLNPAGPGDEQDHSENDRSSSDRENTASVVLNIISDRAVTGTTETLSLRAEALDPQGGLVDLQWQSSSGVIIENHGSRITWKAPEIATEAIIICKASTDSGSKASAETRVQVINPGIYRLEVRVHRSSLIASRIETDSSEEYVPLGSAKVKMLDTDLVTVTDRRGIAEFDISSQQLSSRNATIRVKHSEWEIDYSVEIKDGATNDILSFYPGYDGISIASVRGDSFKTRLGEIEVSTFEDTSGKVTSVNDVSVNVGPKNQMLSGDNKKAVFGGFSDKTTRLQIIRSGYNNIDNYVVPVCPDGLTIIRARLVRSGTINQNPAKVSYAIPFNNQKDFKVNSAFEIGFGQPMNRSNLFTDLNLVIRNQDTGELKQITGDVLEEYFDIEWPHNTVLRLNPKFKLTPDTRYSFSITDWNGQSLDDRPMHANMSGFFRTANDAAPEVVSTSPFNQATGVGRSGPFSIRFSRPMNTESFFKDTAIEIESVESGAKILIANEEINNFFSVSWRDNDTMFDMVPRRRLEPFTTYIVRLKNCSLVSKTNLAVKDLNNLQVQFETSGF